MELVWPNENLVMNKWMPVFLSLLTIAASGQNTYNLTPKPKILIEKEGHFLLPVRPIIAVAGTDAELRKLVEAFAEQMGKVSGYDTKVFAGNFRIKNGINFVISKDAKLGTDGYFLEITPLAHCRYCRTNQWL
ncbi:MAG: hypothetical protein R2822_19340 [Spirosomataceae bacterium]